MDSGTHSCNSCLVLGMKTSYVEFLLVFWNSDEEVRAFQQRHNIQTEEFISILTWTYNAD